MIEIALLSVRDQTRRLEAEKIRGMNNLIAAAKASVGLLMGVDPASAKITKDRISDFLKRSPRMESIRQAQEVDMYCESLKDQLRCKSDESEVAFQTRRLNILSKIIRCELSQGEEAVVVVDLLMGRSKLDVANLTIVNNH